MSNSSILQRIIIWSMLLSLLGGCIPADMEATGTPTVTLTPTATLKATRVALTPTMPLPTAVSPISTLTPVPVIDPESGKPLAAVAFLAAYGWTVTQTLAIHQVQLPPSFVHKPGAFPLPIYWAFNNELSKAIGLDFKPYLGQPVTATVYALAEPVALLAPYPEVRAIVLTSESIIVGAWITSGLSLDGACSLAGWQFKDILGIDWGEGKWGNNRGWDWGEWLVEAGVVDVNDRFEKALAVGSDQIIRTYFEAIDAHNPQLAYACLTRQKLARLLFLNIASHNDWQGRLYNESYQDVPGAEIENIKTFQLLSLEQSAIYRPDTMRPDAREYDVLYHAEYYHRSSLGLYAEDTGRYIFVRPEISGLGYRIYSVGTGP